MTVRDVYLLAVHEPYSGPEHPRPVNATIVHALTLLNPTVPQPDGGRIYRCLTEFPGRGDGCLVPLSTLTYELDGGQLWREIGDWEAVVEAIVRVSRSHGCDAMPLGLPEPMSALLSMGPASTLRTYQPGGGVSVLGARERQQYIDELTEHVRAFAAQGVFWPGDHLEDPPATPAAMPYKPFVP